MYIRVLGEVRIDGQNGVVRLRRSAERCVLAALAVNVGRPVRVGTLANHVWGEPHPAKAEESIAGYARSVRRAIAAAGGERETLVNRRPHAYELRVDPESVDYHRFRRLAATGHEQVGQQRYREAIGSFQAAVELWTGTPLADLNGHWAGYWRDTLGRKHQDVLCALFEAQLRTGDPAAVVDRANRIIDETVPTDRMLALILYGMARSGHAAAIPDFMKQVTERMLGTGEERPAPAVASLARRLVAGHRSSDEIAGFTVPSPAEPAASDADDEPAASPVEPAARSHITPATSVTMTASGNGQVYQSGGDQYITGT